MAHKVIVPQKKNYVPQFLKQRDINSYKTLLPPPPIWVWFDLLIGSRYNNLITIIRILRRYPLFPPQGGNRFDSCIILIIQYFEDLF